MLRTTEVIPRSHTVLPTQISELTHFTAKSSEGETSCWNLFGKSVAMLSVELSSSGSSSCAASTEVSPREA